MTGNDEAPVPRLVEKARKPGASTNKSSLVGSAENRRKALIFARLGRLATGRRGLRFLKRIPLGLAGKSRCREGGAVKPLLDKTLHDRLLTEIVALHNM